MPATKSSASSLTSIKLPREGNPRQQRSARTDYWVAGSLLSFIGAGALWFFFRHNEILLSGDAVAHINIARRVFDSRTPGILQLGSVWLPLPHLLTIPFILSDRMWRTGIGGSIVSLISYVLAGLGLFRLISRWSRTGAWIALGIFALNPSLLYVQTTALNEPIYLATFIWAVVFFFEARSGMGSETPEYRDVSRNLEKGSVVLILAIFSRYDGWFLACLCWLLVLPSIWRLGQRLPSGASGPFRRSVAKALLLTALGPALWFAYNLGAYRNALNFANGPYSARAIAQRTTEQGAPPYPGENHPWTAGLYFEKAAQLNIGEGRLGEALVTLAAAGSLAMACSGAWFVVVLLWSPIVFYALSIAYGSVPIFLPVWWPFSYYNVRYGLELLPAIAAGLGFWIAFITKLKAHSWLRPATAFALLGIAAVSYVFCWRSTPICLRETRANGEARLKLDREIAMNLKSLPNHATLLAYMGEHSGAFELADFPLRRTINEGNRGTWEESLSHPAKAADFVMASDDDSVGAAVVRHPDGLSPVSVFVVSGQPRVVIYKAASH